MANNFDKLKDEVVALIRDVLIQLYPIYPDKAAAITDRITGGMAEAFKLGHTEGMVVVEKALMDSAPEIASKIAKMLQERKIDE